jgi:hypothetical protein
MNPAKHHILSTLRLRQLASNSICASFLIRHGIRLTDSDADVIANGLLPSEAIRNFERYLSRAGFTSRELRQRYAIFMTRLSASISRYHEGVLYAAARLPRYMILKKIFLVHKTKTQAWREKEEASRSIKGALRNIDRKIHSQPDIDPDLVSHFEAQCRRMRRIGSACAEQYGAILSIPLSPSEREQAEKDLYTMFQRFMDMASDNAADRCHILSFLRRAISSLALSIKNRTFSSHQNRVLYSSIAELHILHACKYSFSSPVAAAFRCILLSLAAAAGARYHHGVCK